MRGRLSFRLHPSSTTKLRKITRRPPAHPSAFILAILACARRQSPIVQNTYHLFSKHAANGRWNRPGAGERYELWQQSLQMLLHYQHRQAHPQNVAAIDQPTSRRIQNESHRPPQR